MRRQRMIAQHRIGADLPEHELRMLGDDAAGEPRHHVFGLVAVDAAVEHGDVLQRETLLEVDGEPAPAPAVDEEPMATMVSGSPLAKRRAVRTSGPSKWLNSVGALQVAGGA